MSYIAQLRAVEAEAKAERLHKEAELERVRAERLRSDLERLIAAGRPLPQGLYDPWIERLRPLAGRIVVEHEYVTTTVVLMALGVRGGGYLPARRLAPVMEALGWVRCKLHPRIGLSRKVARGYCRPLNASEMKRAETDDEPVIDWSRVLSISRVAR
jgi:hypothetical protein